MHLIPRDRITISPNRLRKTFSSNAQQKLTDSILYLGLLQPIVVESVKYGSSYILLAGERRLRSLDAIATADQIFYCDGIPVKPGSIPATLLVGLDDEKRKEVELVEHIYHFTLSLHEYMEALVELEKIRSMR